MKAEAWLFASCTIFLVLVTPSYWFITDGGDSGADWTGTSALTMTTLLTGMVTLYLGFHAKKMAARREDRKAANLGGGAVNRGFFPPYSWWPLWCGSALAVMVFGVAAYAW